MPEEPFFRPTDDGFEPTPSCRGPWGPTTLHGRVVAGLLAHEAESNWGSEGFRAARMTIDLYRMPVFAPVQVRSSAAREGRRIKVVDTEFINGGKSAGRASIVFLAESKNPPGEIWTPGTWDTPHPTTLPPPPPPSSDAKWKPIWETRPVGGGFRVVDQKRAWIRETRELVEGVPLTPLLRVALGADLTSPLANSGSGGLQYLNADITFYIHRYPDGEWVGFETIDHQATDGIAFGSCRLYDEVGPIGTSAVTALHTPRED
ncbi:MAG TPA: thioesterase family protein [Dehalococcoidia bacterium]|nr:thioesterase family protein [Dehalococcoidia bacterium]